jgi:hypothetical protein
MKYLLSSKHFYIEAGLFAAFWISTRYLDTKTTLLLTNSLLLSTSVAVAVAYIPVAWRAIRGFGAPEAQHIKLGISYHWTFGALWRMWSLLWITSGQQSWMVNNDVVAFFQAGIALGGMYHLTSPGALGTSSPSAKMIWVSLVVGVTMFVTSILAVSNPDTRWIAEAIRPFVPGQGG